MKNIIIAIIAMAFAATSCSNKMDYLREEEPVIQVLHNPATWDSSLYVTPLVDDSIIEVGFAWSTGEETPTISTSAFGEYEFTYTKVYASGTISSIKELFVADSGVLIDPVIKVKYLWSTGEITPSITNSKPGSYSCKRTCVYASGICCELSKFFEVCNDNVYIRYSAPYEYDPNEIKGYTVVEFDPSSNKFTLIKDEPGIMFDSGYLIKGEICK